jgi:hypothetical protein
MGPRAAEAGLVACYHIDIFIPHSLHHDTPLQIHTIIYTVFVIASGFIAMDNDNIIRAEIAYV